MSALTREELIEACAALYAAANDNFMLPPLIHGADDERAPSRSAYQCLGGDIRIEFVVSFDAEQVRQSGFPLEKLPVRFKAQLSDSEGRDLPIQLGVMEMAALTYAFLLGVRTPISLELEEDDREGKCSIQLAPAFFVKWRQPFETGEQTTAEQVCRSVGKSLCDKSRELFLTEADGVSIWSLRAAQELLGEPKPSADDLWARFSLTLLPPSAPQAAAAAITPVEPLSAPAAPVVPGGALLPAEPRRLRYAAAAVLALTTALAASQFSAAPGRTIGTRVEASLAEPAESIGEEAREPVFEPMKIAALETPVAQRTEPSTQVQDVQTVQEARIAGELEPAQAAAVTEAALVTPAPRAAATPPSPVAAGKPAAPSATIAKSAAPAHPATRKAARKSNNPFDAVGRALNSFTTGVARSLHLLSTL
ncbi:MAG TPA: hypothetical protein VED87_09455 [Methylocystis sp.]|nr:hypothetical protein [Methylocystis sp.]